MSKVTIWAICPLSGKLEYCSQLECYERQERNELDECKRKILLKQNRETKPLNLRFIP